MRAYLTRSRILISYPAKDTIPVERTLGEDFTFEKRVGLYAWNSGGSGYGIIDGMKQATFPDDFLLPVRDCRIRNISNETKKYYENKKLIVYASPNRHNFLWEPRQNYEKLHIVALDFRYDMEFPHYVGEDFLTLAENDVYLKNEGKFYNAVGKRLDYRGEAWGAELQGGDYHVSEID